MFSFACLLHVEVAQPASADKHICCCLVPVARYLDAAWGCSAIDHAVQLYFLGIRPKDLPGYTPHSKPRGLRQGEGNKWYSHGDAI